MQKLYFEDYCVDCSKSKATSQIMDQLSHTGLATFTGIETKMDLVAFAKTLGTIYSHRDADAEGVTLVASKTNHPIPGYQGFTNSALTLHTDSSSEHNPPSLMLFHCMQQAEQGGESLVLDAQKIYHLLKQEHPSMLQALLTPHSAIFGSTYGGQQFSGAIFTPINNNRVAIHFRLDNMGYYAAPLTTYLPLLSELMSSRSSIFTLKSKQGYILQNNRWLHGRTPFTGERRSYRILLNTQNIPKGFQS